MKPTVSIDQCFILFLQLCMPTRGVDASNLLERFGLFTQALAMPFHEIDPPLGKAADVESALQVAMSRAKSSGLPKMLVAGGALEKDVTVIAMNGLAQGFDVYLLADTLVQVENNYSNLYWNRLIQAGAVPTTLVQMVTEWIATDSDIDKSQKIRTDAERFGLFVSP